VDGINFVVDQSNQNVYTALIIEYNSLNPELVTVIACIENELRFWYGISENY